MGLGFQQQIAAAQYRDLYGNTFAYYYSYNQAGRVTTNTLQASNGGTLLANLAANYSWDSQGRMTNMAYPSGTQYTYQYDAIGRLSQIESPTGGPAVAAATYTGPGQLSTLTYLGGNETRTYNSLMQLTQLTNSGVNMQYIYPAGQNNGRVSQTVAYSHRRMSLNGVGEEIGS